MWNTCVLGTSGVLHCPWNSRKFTAPLRKLTDPLENADYALKLPTGFNIMVKAIKK